MKKLGNAILMIDIPFNVVGIILCVWRINIMLHSNLQRLIDEEGGIGTANTLIVVGAVCCCMFLVLNIICAVGRARHKESMIAEGMTGISFLIKIMCIIIFWRYTDYSYNMKRDGGRSMNRLFRDILRENKNDYIRTVLGCSWIISLIYFSTAVGGCLSYISTGSIPQMTYLIIEVEKEFLIPYGLLLILLILLLSGYIRKRAAIYKTLTVFGMKRKYKYRFILFEYLGIVGFSIILGIVLGIYESKGLKIILEYFFTNIKGHIQYGEAPLKLTLIISFLIFGLGFIVCDQAISCLGIDYLISNESETRQRTKVNIKMCFVTIIMAGITIISLMTYWGKSGNTIPTLLAVITILLFLYFYGAYFIKRFERGKGYYKKILWIDDWCSNFTGILIFRI